MSAAEEMKVLGSKISNLINKDNVILSSTYSNVDDHAFREMVNSIAFALNGQEPLFFNSKFISAKEGDGGEIEFVVFTATHILRYSGEIKKSAPTIQILPRKNLSSLTVLTAPKAVPNQAWDTSDGNASYELTYGEETKFTLPVDPKRSHGSDDYLNEMLESLMNDLSA